MAQTPFCWNTADNRSMTSGVEQKKLITIIWGSPFFFFCAREFGFRVKKKVDFVALSLSCVDNCDARGCDYENKKHV